MNKTYPKLLQETWNNFLMRADARFNESEEIAVKGLKALLQPVNDRLQRYEEGVAKVEAERRDSFGNLVGLIESMRVGQEKVSSEAAKMVNRSEENTSELPSLLSHSYAVFILTQKKDQPT